MKTTEEWIMWFKDCLVDAVGETGVIRAGDFGVVENHLRIMLSEIYKSNGASPGYGQGYYDGFGSAIKHLVREYETLA